MYIGFQHLMFNYIVIGCSHSMDITLKHPFSMIVAGSRRAGKSEFTKRLLLENDRMISPKVEQFIWIYSTWQKELFSELLARIDNIQFIENLPQSDIEQERLTNGKNVNTLYVIDDLMNEVSERVDIKNLFTRGRHINTSIIFLTQNLFHKGKHTRDMSLNSDYLVVFKNPRDTSSIGNLAKQMMPGNSKFLQWAYRDATLKPFSYLFIDLRPDTDERVRYRTNILEDVQYTYIAPLL